jgi:hypothetical protein
MTEPTWNEPNEQPRPGDSTEEEPVVDVTAGATLPEPAHEPSTESSAGQVARDAVSQLQSMIDSLATHAAPVVREIGAKAAELAAAAAERSGPVAHRAAEVTEEAGTRLASKAREVAAGLRRDGDSSGTVSPSARVEDSLDTAADDPVEGRPDV